MLGFDVSDNWFNCRPTPHPAFGLRCDASLLSGDIDHELMFWRRVGAAVAGVGHDAHDGAADKGFHLGNDGR